MKHWRTALAGLLALLATGFALVWFLPARWALPLFSSRLNGVRLEQVSGLLWDGRAGRVISARGEPLGEASWRLSRRALLGDNRLQLALHGPQLDFSGHMRGRSAAAAEWTQVSLRTDLGLFAPLVTLPVGQPRGQLRFDARRVQLRGGWPMALDGQLLWRDATLLTARNGTLPLGNLRMTVQASNGVLDGHLQDDGEGPLRIDGRLQLSPLARRFTADAAARDPASPLQRWLSGLGDTDEHGVTHINYSGGLAAAMNGGR
ncbi:type II secretion system protein N [Dyella sp. C9]|uniref:type II secretion system protein N n=1 Tax=Dyella sp. C9 TaxID=2202154 RepID=UPI000DEEAFAA|nr:type II secretion system protein N [Dyella sp. C9]